MAKDIDTDEAPCGDCPCCSWATEQEQHEIEYHASAAKIWQERALEMESVADLLVDVLLKINNGDDPDGLDEAIERYQQTKEEES
jgi:hypothetical protein